MRHRPEVVGRSNLLPRPHPQRAWRPAVLPHRRHSATNGPDRNGYARSGLWLWITSRLHSRRGGAR